MDETGKERPHMHERHTNAIRGTKKRAIGSRLINASKLSQIGDFFFNLAELNYSQATMLCNFAIMQCPHKKTGPKEGTEKRCIFFKNT